MQIVRADSKGVTGAFCVRADSKGLSAPLDVGAREYRQEKFAAAELPREEKGWQVFANKELRVRRDKGEERLCLSNTRKFTTKILPLSRTILGMRGMVCKWAKLTVGTAICGTTRVPE